MILEPNDFNSFLADIGQDYAWRKAYACPCVNPHSGAADLSCTHCSGKGQLWSAAVDVRFGAAGQDVQKAWAGFGQYESGDQVAIVPSDSPAYGIGPFDRVLAKNRTEPFSVNLIRGVNDRVDFAVQSIDRVLYLDAASNLVDAKLPRVLSTGRLDWGADGAPGAASADGFVPATDVTYSLSGRRFSEFYVFQNMPFDRAHFQGQALPRKVVLRRFDLFSR